MANASNTEKPKKTSFFRGVKQEWKKITWPSKNDVVKQTAVVLVAIVLIGALIFGVDALVKLGMEWLTNLSF